MLPSYFDQCTRVCKMLTLREARWRVYRKLQIQTYKHFKTSVNPKLFENKKLGKKWDTAPYPLEMVKWKTINAGEDVGQPLVYCSWECKVVEPLWKIVWQFVKTLNIHLPILWISNTTPRYLYEKTKNICLKKALHKNVHINFIHNSQRLEIIQMSITRIMDKQGVVYSHNGIVLSNKKRSKLLIQKQHG